MHRATRSLALVTSLCAMLTACGGGEEASLARADAHADAQAQPTPAASGATGGASALDTQRWAERAAINRAEVEQPTTPSAAAAGNADALKSTATAPAITKAITAPEASIYRFLNSQTGSHLYTRSLTERDTILNTLPQYRFEGPVFGAWQATTTGLFPVYRFANTANGTHFFTISETEKNNVLATAPYMHLEGAAYYASKTAQAGTTPLYRFYHRQKGFHFYTASASESQYIQTNLAATYQYEGVGYYVNASIGNYDRALASFAGKVNAKANVNGQGENARFGNLRGMAFDPAGNLYVVDRGGDGDWYSGVEVRRVSPAGLVSSFAGSWNSANSYVNGVGSGIAFGGLASITFDANGTLYFGDIRTTRSITPSASSSTIAGKLGESGYINGQAQAARFLGVRGIARDSAGNLFVSECFTAASHPSSRIRKITPTGVVSTFAGAPTIYSNRGFVDGQGTDARFSCPGQIAIDVADNLYVADEGNNRIRKITPSGWVTTLAGQSSYGVVDGVGSSASFAHPYAITVNKATGDIYTADWDGYTVRRITPDGTVTTVVGVANTRGVFFGSLPAGLAEVGGLAINGNRLYIASLNGIYWTNLPQ